MKGRAGGGLLRGGGVAVRVDRGGLVEGYDWSKGEGSVGPGHEGGGSLRL